MNLWRKSANQQRAARLKHDFVIGPQRHNELFGRPARLYYCVRCKWSFMVCGSTVAVLDEDGSPVAGEESLRRFNTLAEGPCPVLEAFVSATLAAADALRPPVRRRRDEPVNPAPSHIPAWSYRPRPLLYVLSRVREG
jgi:hypothetical protein